MGLAESITVRVGANISPFRADMGRAVTGVRRAGTQMRTAFGDLRRQATQAGLAITATLGIASVASIKAATSYEKGLAEISTLTENTADEMARLGMEQRELAKLFGSDIVKQLRGVYDGISAGVTDAGDSMAFMTVVNKAAVAGLTEVNVAGEGILRLMKAYGPEVVSAAKASDILFTTVKKGVTTFGELAPVVGRAAGVFAAANQPVEQLGAAIATITGTAKTQEAIVQASQIVASIIKPAQGAIEVAAKMGLQFDANALSVMKLSGVMDNLRERLGIVADKEFQNLLKSGISTDIMMNKLAITTGTQVSVLAELFPNVRALRGALALLTAEGSVFTENLRAMDDATGATNRAFGKMSKTGALNFKRLNAEATDLKITLGEALAPAALTLLNDMAPVIGVISEWVAANPDLTASIASVVVQVTIGAAIFGTLGFAVSGVVALFGALISIGGVVMGALGLIAAAMMALMGPIGLVVAGVAAFVAVWVEDMGGIGPAWEAVVDFVKETGGGLISWFQENWGAIRDTTMEVFRAIWNFLRPIVLEIVAGVMEAFGPLIEWFKDRWPEIQETFMTVFSLIGKWWDSVGKQIWENIKAIIAVVWETIVGVIKGALKIVTGIWDVWMGIFRGDFDQFWEGIKSIFGGVWDIITSVFAGSWELMKVSWNSFTALFSVLWNAFWDGITAGFFLTVEGIKALFQGMVDFVLDLWGGIQGMFESIGNFFAGEGGVFEFFGFAEGGLVTGPPGRDAIHAGLTSGEYVVNAESTGKNLSLLQMLNRNPDLFGGDSGPSLSFAGGLEMNFPNVRTARDAREISQELDRLDARGQRSLNRRGLR